MMYNILTPLCAFDFNVLAGIAASQWAHEYLGNLSSSSADITDAIKYKTTALTLKADTTAALRGVLLLAGSAIPYNFKETPQHRALPFMQVIFSSNCCIKSTSTLRYVWQLKPHVRSNSKRQCAQATCYVEAMLALCQNVHFIYVSKWLAK
jgi:hypothetical protein